jgi:hypothetical protein
MSYLDAIDEASEIKKIEIPVANFSYSGTEFTHANETSVRISGSGLAKLDQVQIEYWDSRRRDV